MSASIPCCHCCDHGTLTGVPDASQWLTLHFLRGNMPVLPKQPVEESLFLSFTPFLPVYFPFSPVSFERSFCSPDNSLLLGIWLTNISSLSVTGLSIHLPRSFAEQKVLTSDEEQVISFSLLCMFLVSNPRILPPLALDSKDLPLFFFLRVSQS